MDHRNGRTELREFLLIIVKLRARHLLIAAGGSEGEESSAPILHNGAITMKDDDIIQSIENVKFDAGPIAVERRNCGFAPIHAETRIRIARHWFIGRDDLAAILYSYSFIL